MVLTCISLMISDAKHLSMCLFPILCLLLKVAVQIIYPFLNQVIHFFVMLSCMSSLYILAISPLEDISFAKSFPHLVGCSFVLFMVSFELPW